jgi:hypothetical protein
MQNLEPEEEINVSDSPAQQVILQRVSADSSQQTSAGCSNKNRKKKQKVTSFKTIYIYISLLEKCDFCSSSRPCGQNIMMLRTVKRF